VKKTDARKLTTEAQQIIRYQAIRLHEKGFSGVKSADLLGVSPSGVNTGFLLGKKGAKVL